jgi:hypothetical protein
MTPALGWLVAMEAHTEHRRQLGLAGRAPIADERIQDLGRPGVDLEKRRRRDLESVVKAMEGQERQ